jgi:hypothetical protein
VGAHIDAPPIDGSARQKLAWLMGIVLTLLLLASAAATGAIINHESRLATHDTQLSAMQVSLVRIEAKLDRVIERQWQ